ncbi:MAG: NAD+ synthase [Alistipes sp.]|nr:NAD+ synthase [Alistipes sp.]
MKIALAQLNYTVGDINGNATKIIGAIQNAKSQGADLVLFAEYALSGTPAYDLLRKTTFLTMCEEVLEDIAVECKGITAIVGTPLLTDKGPVSAAAVLRNSCVDTIVEKQYVSARRELGFIVPGSGYKIIQICNRNVAIMVGDDLSHMNELDDEANFVISINARRYGKGLLSYRYELALRLTYTEGRNIIIINQVGGAGDLVYDGMSGIMNRNGKLELLMKDFEEDFVIFDTLAEHTEYEAPFTSYNHRNRMVYRAACLGLRDYFHKNGYQKACVGLSGGIDSAVVACLAVGALGAENVKALMLPSQFSSESSVEDAKELATNLGIEYSVLPINSAYDAIMGTLKPVTGGTKFDSTEENIQSRIRTVLLMALQNKDNYILLNCSNKSENALGWCTLYGDTAGAFSVTGDLYKSEIYDLARYINQQFDNPIPESILKKEPSSELRPNQKDSDILPPYEIVDAILYRMIEKGQHREEIINAGFDSVVVEKIHKMIMDNVKKRYQYPPVLRLSTCSFRHECLFPLVNKYGY